MSQQESPQTSKDHEDAILVAIIQDSFQLFLAGQNVGFRQATQLLKFSKNIAVNYSFQKEKESNKASDQRIIL
jgi:hypothetical protein